MTKWVTVHLNAPFGILSLWTRGEARLWNDDSASHVLAEVTAEDVVAVRLLARSVDAEVITLYYTNTTRLKGVRLRPSRQLDRNSCKTRSTL